jgi:hypothetical protein
LFLTAVGLRKSILDATEPIRDLFVLERIHDYAAQGQGKASKRILPAFVHSGANVVETTASLYRPVTKKGDPRLWISGLGRIAQPGDVCALFCYERSIHLLNLSKSNLAVEMTEGAATPLIRILEELSRSSSSTALELLGLLKALARSGPIPASCEGSTAVGRSVENALGIKMNSSRDPDFKGIEIKSGRSSLYGRDTRANLFACVPDWELSRCGSSRQILEEFGYTRGTEFKLYCTVSSTRANSQGLLFEFGDARRWLKEVCERKSPRDVAVWRLSGLEDRLSAKHPETFWLKARSTRIGGREHFELKSIVHTRNPNIPQLERMLRDGTVTMDHLIKQKPSGGAHEKGPLFKIERTRIPELFLGEPQEYALT